MKVPKYGIQEEKYNFNFRVEILKNFAWLIFGIWRNISETKPKMEV